MGPVLPVPTLVLLKCTPVSEGWRVITKGWVFQDETLLAVQAKAREIFPEGVFVIYFPKRRKKRRNRR